MDFKISGASPKFFLFLVQLAPLRCDHCFAVLNCLNSFLIGCQMLIAPARYRVPYSASGILAEVISPVPILNGLTAADLFGTDLFCLDRSD